MSCILGLLKGNRSASGGGGGSGGYMMPMQQQQGIGTMGQSLAGNGIDDPLVMIHPNIPIPLMKVPLQLSGYSNYGNPVYATGNPAPYTMQTSPIQIPLQSQSMSAYGMMNPVGTGNGYRTFLPQAGYGYGPHSMSYGYRNEPYEYY